MKTDFVKTDDDETKLICDTCYFLVEKNWERRAEEFNEGKMYEDINSYTGNHHFKILHFTLLYSCIVNTVVKN